MTHKTLINQAWSCAGALRGCDVGIRSASIKSETEARTKNAPIKIATKSLSEDGTFEGYGSIFDVVDSVGDIVAPGAYAETIKAHADAGTAPKMLWQHNPSEPIGVWTEMREDDRGLWMKGRLILDVAKAREAHALMKAGALDGLSIGFEVTSCEYMHPDDAETKYGWYGGNAQSQIRVLTGLNLWEVSVVTFPACEPARVDAVKAQPRPQSYRPVIEALARRQQAITEMLSRVAV